MPPLVAEIYGHDYEAQIRIARQLEETLTQTPDLVDFDIIPSSDRLIIKVDRISAGKFGISQSDISLAIATLIETPYSQHKYSLKWYGEWQITYETFRNIEIARSVGHLLIYLLIVAQSKSYTIPLMIMTHIPLTIIGVLPGLALLNAQFTATSMIGMIALAGIIVRNPILLVYFVHQLLAGGMVFENAMIKAAVVHSKPIGLTALAVVMSALFILDDLIFNGLAISLIGGILISTLLTLIVIPVLYCILFCSRYAGTNV